jgi:hypothetical protein
MSAVAAQQALFARPSSREMSKVIDILPQASFLAPGAEETGWWKIDAVLDFVATRGLDRVVWMDGELPVFDPRLGVTYREAAEDALADAGVAALLMAPDPTRGLNDSVAQLVEEFAFGRLWSPVWSIGAPQLEAAV